MNAFMFRFRCSTRQARNLRTNKLAIVGGENILRCASLSTASTERQPAYDGHIPLNRFENAFLAVGSGVMSFLDPYRGDMVAALGETTAGPALPRMRDLMLESAEGRRILKKRPRINSSTVDMEMLAKLPEGTFGRQYITWLERCEVTPDTREPVRYIDDPELAYVMQRYRECHDLYHCICSMPVTLTYELALKAFEFANLGLPMTLFAFILGPVRLSSTQRARLYGEYLPWAIKCGSSARSLTTVYWEERWEQNVDELKKELGIWDPPPAKWKKPLKEVQETNVQRREMAGKAVVS